jgi:hypothetical protein
VEVETNLRESVVEKARAPCNKYMKGNRYFV